MAQEKNPGRGWVRLWRKFWDSPDFAPEPFTEREAFLWSVTQAAHAPHLQWFNGVQVPVDRGEFATSSRKLATAFQWGEKRARTFMGRMEKRGKWTRRTPHEGTHLATIIAVCNYEVFQSRPEREDAPKDAPKGAGGTHLGRASDAQQENSNNSQNAKEEEKLEANASRSLVPALPFGDAIEAWSQIAAIKDWKPVTPTQPLSDKRRKGLRKILSAHGLAGWTAALQRAADSELLGGPDPPAWFNFEFVCNPNNFTKVSEGNYDRSFNNQSQQGAGSAWLNAAQTSLATAFDVVPPAIVKQLWLDTDSHYWSDDAPKMLARAKHDGTAEAIPGLAAEATAALAPIERKPLLDRLTLLGMSMANGKDAAQIEAWLHETARLLERFPAAVLLPALDECAMQYKFLPTVAEINDKAEPRVRTLQRRAARLNRLAQMIADGVPLPEYAPPPEDASKPIEKPWIPAVGETARILAEVRESLAGKLWSKTPQETAAEGSVHE